MQMRSRRPHRELTSDSVQHQLATQVDLLTNLIFKLDRGASLIDKVAARLAVAREGLCLDAADKVRATATHSAGSFQNSLICHDGLLGMRPINR
jgi:hypothetical protein